MKKFYSWRAAANAVEATIEGGRISVLSLDIFDTLLIRTTDPVLVIEGTCRWLAKQLGKATEAVIAARHRACSLVAATAVSHGHDPETPAIMLFYTWIRMLAGSEMTEAEIRSMAARAIEYEVGTEKICLVPNRSMLRVLNKAKDRGVRTVAVSDMYLESNLLAELLENHGVLSLIDCVVSSADYSAQKRTGKMFDIGMSQSGFYQNASHDRILHIGDDPTADGVMPGKKGIQSFVVYDRQAMTSRNRAFYMHRDHGELAVASAEAAYANIYGRTALAVADLPGRLAVVGASLPVGRLPSSTFGIFPIFGLAISKEMRQIGVRKIAVLQMRTIRRTLIKSPPGQAIIARLKTWLG